MAWAVALVAHKARSGILCPAVYSSQVPGKKRTGRREGRSRFLKRKLSGSIERRNESSQSHWAQRQRGISPSMTHTSVTVISDPRLTMTAWHFQQRHARICSFCEALLDGRRMVAGDRQRSASWALQEVQSGCWGVPTNLGISEESARKGLRRWWEEVWDAAGYIVRRPVHFGGLWRATPPPSHWFVFIALHEPMDVQFHCVIEKGFSWSRKKRVFPIQRLWRSTSEISKGN